MDTRRLIALLVGSLAATALFSGCTTQKVVDEHEHEHDEEENHIDLVSSSFDPDNHTMHLDDEATWNNHETRTHRVVPDNATLWGDEGSGDLKSGDSYAHTFNATGTYWYHCPYHATQDGNGTWSGMVGVIIVVEEDEMTMT